MSDHGIIKGQENLFDGLSALGAPLVTGQETAVHLLAARNAGTNANIDAKGVRNSMDLERNSMAGQKLTESNLEIKTLKIEVDTLKRAKEVLREEFGEGAESVKYYDAIIAALEELLQYRYLGTLEECREAMIQQRWIPITERYPSNEESVEITYVYNHYETGETTYLTARAFYTDGTMGTEESIYCWEETDNWEYDEEKDAYIIPEGWWEDVSFTESFAPVDKKVIAWRPSPDPYKEETT